MASHELDSKSTLLVEGPACIRLAKGEAFSLGAPLEIDAWTTLREDGRLLIETMSHCSLEIRLGRGGKYEKINGSTIPTGWREASQIAAQTPGVIAVLGDVDSGKSTFCTFLANECFKLRSRVSIIDGDVGQADIGPPTTISMSLLREQVFSLQYLQPDTSLFIGDTSPSTVPEKVSSGLVRLRDLAKYSDLVLIDTDGWVKGEEAFRYKTQLLNSIQPNLVLAIGSQGETDLLLEHQRSTVLKLDRSPYARTRSREERKRAREAGYARFLQTAKPVSLSLRDVQLRRFDSYHQLKIRQEENLRGLIAGLLDDEDRLLAISRVESLRNGTVTVRTTLEYSPRTIELGAVFLSPKYEELGYDV